MKKIYTYLMMLTVSVLIISCNAEWDEEQYEQYVSFSAPVNDKGVTDIYVRYKQGGEVTYKLPMIVSGSIANGKDRTVHIAVDTDTLDILNQARFGREDLYYVAMEDNRYSFPSTVNIPAGTFTTLLDITFKLDDIDLFKKWVLPLSIEDDPSYNYVGHPRKNYAKALLRVLPFNDYSGSYSSTAMQVYIKDRDGNIDKSEAIATTTRTAYVVDENSVFFYAGAMDEDLINRDKYKVKFYFEPDGEKLVKITSDNDKIKLKQLKETSYTIAEVPDVTRPYLLHRYVTFSVDYEFVDYTSANEEIPYYVTGVLTLERNINTQIPDEDQAREW